MSTFVFYSDCVNWPRKDVRSEGGLSDMIDQAIDITRVTFLKYVDREQLRDLENQLGYGPWLRMASDWVVSYHRSKLHGQTVYYFRHSAIEYVFVDPETFNETASNPPATDIVLSRDYYHATSDFKAGPSILKSGLIMPRPGKQGRYYQAPRSGFVYMSPQLYYASIYALGGVWMGHDYTAEQWRGGGCYGYIFLIHKGDLVDVEPDEDDVGEMATSQIEKLKSHAPGWLKRMAYDEAMRSSAKLEKYRRAVSGEMAYQSIIGKQLLKRLSRDQKQFLMNMTGVNIANRGPVGFDAAWRLDKSRAPEIAEDGSNVLEIAERIK